MNKSGYHIARGSGMLIRWEGIEYLEFYETDRHLKVKEWR
jgi:hypothetical protein